MLTTSNIIRRRRPSGQPSILSSSSLISISLCALLLVAQGGDAIVKQNQQQQQQASQQSRSDDSSQQVSPSSSSSTSSGSQLGGHNNHQQQQQQSGQPSTYSSSVSISSSSSSASSPSASQSASSNGGSQLAPQQQASPVSSASYGSSSGSGYGSQVSAQPKSGYGSGNGMMGSDNMAANSQDSYQAAASSVNMALANSGIYNNNYNQQQQQPSGVQSSQAVGGSSGSSPSNSAPALNPLHYFYYPPKESSNAAPSPSVMSGSNKQQVGGMDMMANAASNNYQSMAFPSYGDQMSFPGLGASSASGPEASASNQDASYLPQPGMDNGQQQGPSMYSGLNMGAQQQQQQQPQQQQSQMHNSNGNYQSDLSSYASNMNPSQGGQPGQAQQHQSTGGISFGGSSSSGDYLNSHLSSGHQGQGPNGYQASSVFNQMGDLSTSNFGNNPAGLNSVASYMSPQQSPPQQAQQQHAQNQPQSSHDLFGNSQGFASAASQLSQSSVSPPLASGQQNSAGSSIFGSSLFGTGPNGQSQQNGGSAANGNLFASQQYLNSFLSPAQYTHLTGQQIPTLDAQQQQALLQSQSVQQPTLAAAPSSGQSSAVAGSGSSKRFGISSFIMPMLALAGLSLLIPTMSNIGTAVGRKKRSVEDKASAGSRQQSIAFDSLNGIHQLAKEHSIGEYMDKIERYYSIYKNAVENDDCLNRLICEFGDAVKDVTGKSAIVTVIEKLVPHWMVGKVHLFKEAALNEREGKEKCKKYVCHSNRQN